MLHQTRPIEQSFNAARSVKKARLAATLAYRATKDAGKGPVVRAMRELTGVASHLR